jgi:hypothetical protein
MFHVDARTKALIRMQGDVLAENLNMLKFAKGSGLVVSPDREDPSLVNISLDLQLSSGAHSRA